MPQCLRKGFCREKVEEVKIETDYGDGLMGLNQIGGGEGGVSVIRPCAACKQMRRRCSAEGCPFYPYFPPHEPLRFASVHRVFGTSNVSKMLTEVPESLRADVANSLVYEADARLRDPVYGCTAEISALRQQVESLQQQLNSEWAELLKYKNPHHEPDMIFKAEAEQPSPYVASLPSIAKTAALPPVPSPTVLLVPPPPPTSSGSLLLSSSASSNQYNSPPSSAADFSTISS